MAAPIYTVEAYALAQATVNSDGKTATRAGVRS